VEEVVQLPKEHTGKKSAEHVIAQVKDPLIQTVSGKQKTALIDAPTSARPVKAPKRSRASTKPRRKLQLDDELESLPKPTTNPPQSERSEDTFIFGLKPKNRQPESRLKETIEEDPTHDEIETAPAPSRRKRTARAKQQANDEACEKVVEELEVFEVEGQLRKIKGKPTPRERADALYVDINPPEEAPAPIATGMNSPKEKLLQNPRVEKTKPQIAPKATKAKATTKKAAKRAVEEDMENDTATVTEPTARRPRRQAAVSATAKVALGYEEELVPADKLRRAPEPPAKRGRPKKNAVLEHVTSLADSKARPIGEARKQGDRIPKVGVLASVKQVTVEPAALEDTHHVAETEALVTEAPPVKKTRKARVQLLAQGDLKGSEPATAHRASDGKEADEVEQTRPRASKAPPSRTTRKTVNKEVKPVDVIDEMIVAAIEPPDIEIPETQMSQDIINDSDSLAGEQVQSSRGGRTGGEKRKPRRVLAESDVNIVKCLPSDDFGTTVKSAGKDKDIDRARTKQSSRKTKAAPVINPTIEHDESKHGTGTDPVPNSSVGLIHTKRARKAQPAQQSKVTPAVEPPDNEPATERKRHVIAADEDLDWLFEKCDNKRSRLPTGNPCAYSKVKRQAPVKKSADAKEMDLDDLLESIAGFSGKLLTGKSGRAMASR